MPQVFLRYSRQDLRTVEALAGALQAAGIAVWRDQECLYGEEQWPRAIGEAIAAHDGFLLVWYTHAAGSHVVEFEWNSALALRKTILPCVRDDTPLPPALSAINAIDVRSLEEALPRILQSLRRHSSALDPVHRATVIAQLQAVTLAPPEQVVQAAKTLFEQEGWRVQGHVSQAGRDLQVTVTPPAAAPAKTLAERWQTWVAVGVGVLLITTFAADLPGKIRTLVGPGDTRLQVIAQPLSGTVWDEQHDPLAGVDVVLPELNQVTFINRHGAFAFHLHARKAQTVDLLARKEGYTTSDADATVGNTSFNFVLRRKP